MKKVAVMILVLVVFLMAGISLASDSPAEEVAQQSPVMQPGDRGPGPGQRPGGPMQNQFMKMRREPGKPAMDNRQMMMKRFFLAPQMVRTLGLSDEQVAKLEKMRDDNEKKTIDMRANIAKAGIDLRALMNAKDLNIPAIQAQMQKMADMKVQMQISHLKAFEQAKTVLTDAQKTKLEQFRKQGPGQFMKGRTRAGEDNEKELGIMREEELFELP